MDIVMAETATRAGKRAAEALRAAGHTVHSCHAPGERGVSCAALEGRNCPLEDQPADAYVLVRPWSRPGPGPVEQGALCAARHRIPLVVAGFVDENPYREWSTAERAGTDIVEAVEGAVARPLPLHTRVATKALGSLLGPWPGPLWAEVHRRAGGLDAALHAEPEPAPPVKAAVAAKVHQRLRALDPWARFVDVSFST